MFNVNINKPQFFLHNTSCTRKPQVISGKGGGGGAHPCTLSLDPPLGKFMKFMIISEYRNWRTADMCGDHRPVEFTRNEYEFRKDWGIVSR